jgi:hypothetical protein
VKTAERPDESFGKHDFKFFIVTTKVGRSPWVRVWI